MREDAVRRHHTKPVSDRLFVIACEHFGWTCVPNDALRKVCKEHGVAMRRGLRLMIDLVCGGALTEARALRLRMMQKANPTHITEKLVDQFHALPKSMNSGI